MPDDTSPPCYGTFFADKLGPDRLQATETVGDRLSLAFGSISVVISWEQADRLSRDLMNEVQAHAVDMLEADLKARNA